MADVVVDDDEDLSNLDPGLEDSVIVKSGATLTVDAQGKMKILQIGDSSSAGHIKFDGYDADPDNPTLMFKSDRDHQSGILIFEGSIEVPDPFSERIILMSDMMKRGERDWAIRAGSGCNISEDLDLIDIDPIEMYGVAFSLIYYDGSEEVNLILPYGPVDLSRSLSIDLDNKKTEKGEPWQEYNYAEGEEIEVGSKFIREKIDRYQKRKISYHSRTSQYGLNCLLASEFKLGFGKIYDVKFGSDSPMSYDFSFEFVEERI